MGKKVKICIVSLYAYGLFNPKILTKPGGAEVQLYYLARELAKDEGCEIFFLVGDFGQPECEVRDGVKIIKTIPIKKRFQFVTGGMLAVKLFRIMFRIKADVYLQRAAGMETGIISLFCRLFGKKFIYMVAHDSDLAVKKSDLMGRGIGSEIRWRLFRIGLRLANFVYVQNDKQKEDLEKNYGKVGEIRLSAHEIREDRSGADKEICLWVARCEKWKKPEEFLKLAKNFPAQPFVMLCPKTSDEAYFNEIKTMAGTIKNVEFIGGVPFTVTDNYFSRAKVFVNTSAEEGFPNTFIQAAKNKTPILSLNSNPNGMLEKYNIGRCAKGDFRKLNSDLNEFLGNPSLWKEISDNAFVYAKENHDVKKIVEQDKKIILGFINK